MKNRITFSTSSGDWGIEGVDLTKLSSKLYGAVMKLKKYEDSGLDPYEVEELQEKAKEVDKLYLEKCQEVNRLVAELGAYRAIGTVEEVKVLEEKSKQKKVIRKPNTDWTHEEVICPTCGKFVSLNKHHCECGQRLNWERGVIDD